jgi:hypothetical protein
MESLNIDSSNIALVEAFSRILVGALLQFCVTCPKDDANPIPCQVLLTGMPRQYHLVTGTIVLLMTTRRQTP